MGDTPEEETQPNDPLQDQDDAAQVARGRRTFAEWFSASVRQADEGIRTIHGWRCLWRETRTARSRIGLRITSVIVGSATVTLVLTRYYGI